MRAILPFCFVAVIALAVGASCSGSDTVTQETPTSLTDTPTVGPTLTSDSPTQAPIATLSTAEVEGIADPMIKAAIDALREEVNSEIASLDIILASQATWGDAALGCPEPDTSYAQVLTSGLWLVFGHNGQDYDYRVTESSVLLCSQAQRQEPLEQTALAGIWTVLAPVPTARSEVAVAELDGKIYVFGGFGAGGTANERYDPATNTWSKLNPIPSRVNHASAVSLDGRIYLIGGFTDTFRPVNNVWAYDPVSDSWTSKMDLPSPRGALGAVALNGVIYAIGGQGRAGDVGTTGVYDPDTDTWTTGEPMPAPRDHLAISIVDDKIYLIGGRLGTFAVNLVDNEVYDPVRDRWTTESPLPTRRSGIAAAVVDGLIYVFGGESTGDTFDENERYDPETDTWESLPPMPTARHGLGAAAIDNRIYVMAGGPTPGGSSSAANEVFIVFDQPDD